MKNFLRPSVTVILFLPVVLYLIYIKVTVSRQKVVWWISAEEDLENFKNPSLDITVKFK